MCGRFIVDSDEREIQRTFQIKLAEAAVQPSYNVAPTQPVLTVVQRDGQRVLQAMRWGLIPVWAKDMRIGAKMINARAETVAEKPSFKRLLKSRRCLILADGFYEWHKDGARKLPMFISVKPKHPFGFAGLYDTWTSPEGQTIASCAIITTHANKLMESIHSRMPVILPQSAYCPWLDPSNQDLEELSELLLPYAGKMQAYAVSPLVNSVGHNSPENIRPAPSEDADSLRRSSRPRSESRAHA
jgi:putative SOS response-associated peptidase YedK